MEKRFTWCVGDAARVVTARVSLVVRSCDIVKDKNTSYIPIILLLTRTRPRKFVDIRCAKALTRVTRWF
jgi:hypothetical protein